LKSAICVYKYIIDGKPQIDPNYALCFDTNEEPYNFFPLDKDVIIDEVSLSLAFIPDCDVRLRGYDESRSPSPASQQRSSSPKSVKESAPLSTLSVINGNLASEEIFDPIPPHKHLSINHTRESVPEWHHTPARFNSTSFSKFNSLFIHNKDELLDTMVRSQTWSQYDTTDGHHREPAQLIPTITRDFTEAAYDHLEHQYVEYSESDSNGSLGDIECKKANTRSSTMERYNQLDSESSREKSQLANYYAKPTWQMTMQKIEDKVKEKIARLEGKHDAHEIGWTDVCIIFGAVILILRDDVVLETLALIFYLTAMAVYLLRYGLILTLVVFSYERLSSMFPTEHLATYKSKVLR
jgi:hypothetical protein